MFNSTINKAVAALITALGTLLGFANVELPAFLNDPNTQAIITAILVAGVTYLVPNKAQAPTNPSPPTSYTGGTPNVAPMVVLAVMLTAVLGGCTPTLQTLGTLSNANNPVTMRDVFVVEAAYSATVLAPAANYRRLGICASNQKPTFAQPCAERDVVLKLQAVDTEVQATLRDVKAYVKKYPTVIGAGGLYEALRVSVARGQSIIATYTVATR